MGSAPVFLQSCKVGEIGLDFEPLDLLNLAAIT